MKKSMRWSVILALAMVITLAAGGTALAADVPISGSVTAGNTAPTIGTVDLQYDSSGTWTSTTQMYPQSEVRLVIPITDANTTADIASVNVVFKTVDTTSSSWDADEYADFTWTSGGDWKMGNKGTTSWVLGASSADGAGTSSTGTWYLYFEPGKLAKSGTSNWQALVTVQDSGPSPVSPNPLSLSMGLYLETSVSTSTIDFGEVALGGSAELASPVTMDTFTNASFVIFGKTDSAWGTINLLESTGNPGAGEFSLAAGTTSPPTSYLSTGDTVLTTLSATATAEGADEAATSQDVYLGIELGASGIPVGTYTGTITLTASNPAS